MSAGSTLRCTNAALTRPSEIAQQSPTRIHFKRNGSLCSRNSRRRMQLSFVMPVLIYVFSPGAAAPQGSLFAFPTFARSRPIFRWAARSTLRAVSSSGKSSWMDALVPLGVLGILELLGGAYAVFRGCSSRLLGCQTDRACCRLCWGTPRVVGAPRTSVREAFPLL